MNSSKKFIENIYNETEVEQQQQKEKIVILSKFSPRVYTKKITEKYKTYSDKNEQLFLFNPVTKLWETQAEGYLKAELRQNLIGEEQQKSYYVKEIIDDIKGYVFNPQIPELPEPQRELMPFNNGVYNLKTNDFTDFKSDFYFTNKLAVDYDPAAKCLIIDKIFKDIVKDPTDLYELVGYALYRDYPYQKIFFLYGSGGNGKSLFLSILKYILGKENIATTSLDSLQINRFSSVELHRKMAAIAGEISYTSLKNTELIKQLTGGDTIRAERKYGQPFQFENYAKLIISTNELPKTTDKTVAFYRRLFLIEFPNQISDTQKEQKGLFHTIKEEEFRGLAFKALQYLQNFIKRGYYFTNDQKEIELRKQYERLTNPLSMFLDKFTEEDPNGFIPKWIFKKAFNQWQQIKGYRVWNDTEIGTEMKPLNYETKQKTLDSEEANNTLNTLNTLSLTIIKSIGKVMKRGVNPVNPVIGDKIWRCWFGLKWRVNNINDLEMVKDDNIQDSEAEDRNNFTKEDIQIIGEK